MDYNKVNLKINLGNMKNSIVGLKELRENTNAYIKAVQKGQSFIVVKKSKPIFKISAPEESEDLWEPVIDFTKIKRGGVAIGQLLKNL